MTSSNAERLLVRLTSSYVRRYFEKFSGEAFVAYYGELPSSLADTGGLFPFFLLNLFLFFTIVNVKPVKMSFSRAPLKRFNDNVGKKHFTLAASIIVLR